MDDVVLSVQGDAPTDSAPAQVAQSKQDYVTSTRSNVRIRLKPGTRIRTGDGILSMLNTEAGAFRSHSLERTPCRGWNFCTLPGAHGFAVGNRGRSPETDSQGNDLVLCEAVPYGYRILYQYSPSRRCLACLQICGGRVSGYQTVPLLRSCDSRFIVSIVNSLCIANCDRVDL